MNEQKITSGRELPPGALNLGYRFELTGPGLRSGTGTLLVNGEELGRGEITKHVENGREGLDVGRDRLTPAGRGYASPFVYPGALMDIVFE